jgi:hypothetical protein
MSQPPFEEDGSWTACLDYKETDPAIRASREHGELNPQANRRHPSLPNHPAARPGAS